MSIFDAECVARVVAQGRSDALRYAAPDGGYNGWSNHPTWNASLVVDNTAEVYVAARALVTTALEVEGMQPEGMRSLWSIGEALRDLVMDEECGDPDNLICPELVNWPEVAWSIIEGLEGDDA